MLRRPPARAPADSTQDKNFILAALPENYRLYEHVKYIAGSDGAGQKSVKNHAAGANERQDAYLYGHPMGRKKRFRSPAEFFPHLLWLVTDESGNQDNCSCKLCCPEEIDEPKKEEVVQKTAATRTEPPQEAKPPQQQKMPLPPVTRTPSNSSSKVAIVTPNPLPRFRSMEQKADATPQRMLYRPGELVWYQRGPAWGLGVIVKRDTKSSQYTVHAVSHPFRKSEITSTSQPSILPWLAWSPPPLTIQSLNPSPANGQRVYSYESVDWNAVLEGRYGDGDPDVDGSILAAKGVESTVMPFQQTSSAPHETHYNGIFIGAEKIWVGDALRMRHSQFPSDILVLHDIIEQPNKTDASRPHILLVGDTYHWRVIQLEPNYVPSDGLSLPSRVREDLTFRNRITLANRDPSRRFSCYWRLDRKGAHLTIGDVKGRWYESGALMPLLQPKEFRANQERGTDIQDINLSMNGLGDCNKPPPGTAAAADRNGRTNTSFRAADTRVMTREEAFGRSISADVRISRGLDERGGSGEGGSPAQRQAAPSNAKPLSQVPQQYPAFQQLQQGYQQQPFDFPTGDFEQMMALDQQDELAFGQ